MQSNEVQLISSLINSLVTSTSDYEMIYKSLIRLPHIQIITNHFISYFSKTHEVETQKKVILLYFKYVLEKCEPISKLDGPILFDHFKHLISETPLFDLLEEYIDFSNVLVFYIQNLKTFSDSSLYQSIIDWSNDNTSIALFSLSEVYDNYFGRCLSNIILNFNQKIPTIVSLSLLLSKHKFELIDQTATDFFNEQNVTSKIREAIEYCFRDDQTAANSNIENKRLGFFLIESAFHFLRETDSRDFYVSISDTIFSVFDKCDDSIQNLALKAFCELPAIGDDEKISLTKQLSTVISAFGKRITDFDSELASNMIEFADKRIKSDDSINLRETIEPLFSVDDQINGASLLACRFDLVDDFYDFIFPQTLTDLSRALSACYSIEYLISHQKISDKKNFCNLIVTFLSAASIQTNGNAEYEKEISHIFEVLIQKFNFESVVKTVFENILVLINSPMIDKIIGTFMKFCKEKSDAFSSIQKVSDEEFIERLFPYLIKFSISPVESPFYISYLFVLIFLNAMKTGEFTQICELIDAPLSLIFQKLIPKECQPKILSKALLIHNSNEEDSKDNLDKNETKLDDLNNLNMNPIDFQSSISLMIISFKNCEDNEIQISVAKSFINKETFNELLFERFFASISYIKSDESIEFFTSLVFNKEEEQNNNSLTSFFLKKSPFLKSFFFQQSELSTKFSKQSIMNTLSYICSLEMNPSSLSKLFSIFYESYELNPKSRSVLLNLVKQHKRCELSDKFIQFIISSEFFVEALPDFFYETESINESILQKSTKTYFDYGDQSNFDQFCLSAFENCNNSEFNCFSVISDAILSFRDVYKMMKFGFCLSKFDSNNSELVPKLTIQFVMNILSNDDQLRVLCQNCLFVLFLLKVHLDLKSENKDEFLTQNFESKIQITSLPFNESVLNCCQFFDEITNTELFKKYSNSIVEIICGISPIELPIVILSLSICKSHFENRNFILYLTKEGNICNNALIRNLINKALSESINHDFSSFMNSIVVTDMTTQFTRDFISHQVKSNEKLHDSIIEFTFAQFLTPPTSLIKDSDIGTGKFQLFLILCNSNTFISEHTNFFNENSEKVDDFSFNEKCKKGDFLLIWLAAIVLVNLNRSSKQISMIVRRDARIGLSDSLKLIFGRFNFECPSIDDRDISLGETFSKKIAQFVFSLTISEISGFIESLNKIDLKKGNFSDITIVIVFILSHLLKSFIQINNSSFISVLTDLIHQLCSTLKDDACRVISAKFASLFTIENLQLFSEEGKKNLLLVSIRSLITPEAATQNSCIIFLSMILAVSPSESIIKQKMKLLDSITRCFDLKKVVGFEILLDSIQSIIEADPDVEPFNNMGLISIPWFLILSVNESKVIRNKSNKILFDLSCSSSESKKSFPVDVDESICYSKIVDGFFEKLGVDVMIVFGNFLVDWSSKNGFNGYSMKLLYQVAVAIKKSDKKYSIDKFRNKTVQALMGIVNDSSNNLQAAAIEVLSVLME